MITVFFWGCMGTDRMRTSDIVNKWIGRTIKFPRYLEFVQQKADTSLLSSKNYQIISYIDSTGCTGCRLQLHKWKYFINELDSVGNTSVSLFLCSQNRMELNHLLKRYSFNHPVCIDEKDSLNILNHFPTDENFQTFLLDKDNKVLAIGNPIHNPKVKELYLKII